MTDNRNFADYLLGKFINFYQFFSIYTRQRISHSGNIDSDGSDPLFLRFMFEISELPDSQTSIATTLQTSIEKIFVTGKITLRDRQILQNALLKDSALTQEQSDRVRAIYERVRMGFIRVVD